MIDGEFATKPRVTLEKREVKPSLRFPDGAVRLNAHCVAKEALYAKRGVHRGVEAELDDPSISTPW